MNRKQKPARERPTMAMIKMLRDELFKAGREQRKLDERLEAALDLLRLTEARNTVVEQQLRAALDEVERRPRKESDPAVIDTLIAENVDFGRVTDIRFATLVVAIELGHTLEVRPTPESGDFWEIHAIRPA